MSDMREIEERLRKLREEIEYHNYSTMWMIL